MSETNLVSETPVVDATGAQLEKDCADQGQRVLAYEALAKELEDKLRAANANAAYWVKEHGIETEKRGEAEHALDLARGDRAAAFELLERERDQLRADVAALNQRLIDRTQAYEAKDVRQLREIQRLTDAYAEEYKRVGDLHRWQMGMLELYQLMPGIENQYVDRLAVHLREKINSMAEELETTKKSLGEALDWEECRKRLDAATSPFCPHNQRYSWSPDDHGKKIVCLLCAYEENKDGKLPGAKGEEDSGGATRREG